MNKEDVVHLGSHLDSATYDAIADIICGDDLSKYPVYRSSKYLTKLFRDSGVNAVHDGSTRKDWVINTLSNLQPSEVEKVILRLANLREYKAEKEPWSKGVSRLNDVLSMDGFKIGYLNNTPVLKQAGQMEMSEDIIGRASTDEKEFLEKKFSDDLQIIDLELDSVLSGYLQKRIDEINYCLPDKTPLAIIIMLGSTLEGVLLAFAINDQKKFISAKSAPSNPKTGAKIKIYDWKLSQLIDVSYEVGILNLDIKKYSHVLRDFRNYIHPYHQMSQNFYPDRHTVEISLQVFKSTFAQLKDRKTL